jgi:nitrate reductase assembly molybdenum cofactor insertion protein NarJ
MSVNGIEAALYELSTTRQARAEFRGEPRQFLAKFGLEEAEAEAIRTFDVRELQARGASALLTYGFWVTNAEERTRGAYLRALRPIGER